MKEISAHCGNPPIRSANAAPRPPAIRPVNGPNAYATNVTAASQSDIYPPIGEGILMMIVNTATIAVMMATRLILSAVLFSPAINYLTNNRLSGMITPISHCSE